MINLYSYVVAHDTGFAPNPFGNYCTLACCKPDIRKAAKVGDWVVGTGSTKNEESDKIIYAMKVTKKISFARYSEDEEYKDRIDNIYFLDEKKDWKPKDNKYHNKYNDTGDTDEMNRDLGGIYVLISISTDFYYFGKKAIDLDDRQLKDEIIRGGRMHKKITDFEIIQKFEGWLKLKSPMKGKLGEPHNPQSSNRLIYLETV